MRTTSAVAAAALSRFLLKIANLDHAAAQACRRRAMREHCRRRHTHGSRLDLRVARFEASSAELRALAAEA